MSSSFLTHSISEAVAAYRQRPDFAQAMALRTLLREAALYIPVGDFNGSTAAIPMLNSDAGLRFIPLYTDRSLVPGQQDSEALQCVDWYHILGQLPQVAGVVVDPYSETNFAFSSDFMRFILASDEELQRDKGAPTPPVVDSSESYTQTQAPKRVPLSMRGAPSPAIPQPALSSSPAPTSGRAPDEKSYVQIGIPNHVPRRLGEAMQEVADTFAVPVWLLMAVPAQGRQSYLMVIDVKAHWFETEGAERINRILEKFPNPGKPLDFVSKESEFGRFVDGRAPHYVPVGGYGDLVSEAQEFPMVSAPSSSGSEVAYASQPRDTSNPASPFSPATLMRATAEHVSSLAADEGNKIMRWLRKKRRQ